MSYSYVGQPPVFGDFPFQVISGNGGSSYTLSFYVSNENGMLVFLNGAIQRPGVDYTAGGNSLVFSSAVSAGVQIFAYGMGLPKSTLAPSDGASIATPIQFDVSNKISTTSFVQTALGNRRGTINVSSDTTLTQDHVGKLVICSGGGPITLTLPSSTAIADGSSILIDAGSATTVTITRQGADTIEGMGVYSASSSAVITTNESAEFILQKSTAKFRFINGSGRSVTQPKFDADTSVATTGFVQNALGNLSGQVDVITTSTLSASDSGKRINLNSAGITVSLPLLSQVPQGALFWVHASAQGTIATQSGNTITAGTSNPSSVSISAGGVAVFVAGSNTWNLEGGDVYNRYASGGPLGVGQTWQDLTASRALATVYTNTTDRPIFVSFYPAASSSKTSSITVNGIVVGSLSYGTATVNAQLTAIVPPGNTYRIDSTSTISMWAELR